jgi:GAF domain-containing protein
MKLRSKAGGKTVKMGRRKAAMPKRSIAPKAVAGSRSVTITKETETARLRRERDEAMEWHVAIGEILSSISGSMTDPGPVFDAIVRNLIRLFGTGFAVVTLIRDDKLELVGVRGEPGFEKLATHYPVPLNNRTLSGKVIAAGKPIQLAPIIDNPESPPSTEQWARQFNYNSQISVPLIRHGAAIGAISTSRRSAEAFTTRQVELVQNFAAQAVIAIENAQLLNELRQRTNDLSEALQQQTASAEVLRVISSSPGDLKPVFDSMLANALRICEARFGNLWLREGNQFRIVTDLGGSQEYHDQLFSEPLITPDPRSAIGQIAETGEVVQIEDISKAPTYGMKMRVTTVEIGKGRTLVGVPMLKSDEVVGVIAIYRQEVRPFTDKQIALVKNFAAQAVIAIDNARLLNELRQSLEQQTATSEVLSVISSSPGELEPVFQTMLENATHICEAKFGFLWLAERDGFRAVAFHNVPPALAAGRRHDQIIHFGPETPIGRVIETRQPVHVADIRSEPAYVEGFRPLLELADIGGGRTLLTVPMLKENEVVGAFAIYRQEVRPFTDKHIALIENFAAQAVIAIENARLLNELRQRTDDLTESLEQQTATSEVLRAISSSTGDLQPVFDAMLTNATRLCGANYGTLWLHEGDHRMRAAALYGNLPEAFLKTWGVGTVFRPKPSVPSARAMSGRKPVQLVDLKEDQSYLDGDPLAVAAADVAGIRSIISVPMVKDDVAIGAMTIYRREVSPFTEKQTELVSNFAAQAVIGIENTRLLNELQQRTTDLTESLEQQTATSKVLEVISRSAFDLQAVFETVVESSVRLCGADRAFIFRFDGELLRMTVAFNNASQEWKEYLAQHPTRPGRDSAAGRAALQRRTVHIPDVQADHEYTFGAKNVEKVRTVLAVPILKGEDLLGVVVIYHLEVRPFTEKQIALVETFADQAAIAIDNVRLLDELQQSLQQQTATADMLKLISRSTFDLKSVLNTLVESAARLCEADITTISREKDGHYHVVAAYGFPPGLQDYYETIPMGQGRGSLFGRILFERKPVQIVDVLADSEYAMRELQKRAGFRTVLGVPLLRDGVPIGLLSVNRTTVRPFTDKQIEFVTAFADQAAIAIENVRLFDEIQDKSRQLEIASQHKSQFLANMSHELRTPLNAILGYTELMADGAYGEPSEKMLGILKRLEANGRHLLGLINDVLDLSKIEAGQLILELSDYCIQDIAQTVRSTLEPLAADKKLGFKVEVAPQLPSGRGDGRRLTQVLINLVGNAIKFTDAGEVAIKAAADNGSFHVSVRDTGPGISSADQAKLFQEFQQADNAITRKKGGTGLGLAISKRIIEMHGGRIWVESRVGQGSTFAFTLPVIVERQLGPA